VLDFYEKEAAKTKATEMTTFAKTHWALMRQGFTAAELGDEDVGRWLGSIAFFHTYHGMGKQHVMEMKAPAYRSGAPTPPAGSALNAHTGAGGSNAGKGREGMEPPFLQTALRVSEIDVFDMLQAKRAEIVAYLTAC